MLVNNADRKGGHCLRALADGHIYGIDHGLTFHVDDKLRTVIWDFAGDLVPDPVLSVVECVLEDLDGALGQRLGELLAPSEVEAVGDRARTLLRKGKYPVPDEGYHSVPWPMIYGAARLPRWLTCSRSPKRRHGGRSSGARCCSRTASRCARSWCCSTARSGSRRRACRSRS